MLNKDLKTNSEIQKRNQEIILEISLLINNELFKEKKISYKMFKYAEANLLNMQPKS